MEEEYAKSNLNTSLSLIWVICQLLPFVRVGQYYALMFKLALYACTAFDAEYFIYLSKYPFTLRSPHHQTKTP